MKKNFLKKVNLFCIGIYLMGLLISLLVYKKYDNIENARYLFISSFNFLVLSYSGIFSVKKLKKEQ